MLRKIVRASQPLFESPAGGIHILIYHLVGGGTGSSIDIPVSEFEAQMDLISSRYNPVSLARAAQHIAAGPVDRTMVVVTFDDAYENFQTHALPVLRKYKVPAMLYVPVGFIEGTHPSPISSLDLRACTWNQLKEFAGDSDISIGSHAWSHVDLRKIEPGRIEQEIVQSQARLQEKLGVPVKSFAYPKALWAKECEPYVKQAYDTAVLRGGKRLSSKTWSAHRLQRTPIRAGMGKGYEQMLASSLWIEEVLAAKAGRVVYDLKGS